MQDLFGDDVNVKSVNVAQYPARDRYTVVIVPTTNIDHVNSIELRDVELVYPDKTYNFDSIELGYNINDADNKLYHKYNSLQKDYQYEFEFIFRDLLDVNRADSYHITADVVINTTTQDNVKVAHIDTDTTLVHELTKTVDRYGNLV